MWPNLTLTYNRSRSTQGHNMKNLGSTHIDNATYQVSRSSVYWFWRSKYFFYGFYHIWACGHVGHVTQLICINFHFHSPLSFDMNFGSKSPNHFKEKQVLTLKSEWPLTKIKEWPWPLILTQLHNSFNWMLQATLRLKAAIVAKN